MRRGSAESPDHDRANDRDEPERRRAVERLSLVARIVSGILHLIVFLGETLSGDAITLGLVGRAAIAMISAA